MNISFPFPNRVYKTASDFAGDYIDQLKAAASSVEPDKINAAAALLGNCHKTKGRVFSCGNGGSAAISNHLVCDHIKSVRADTNLESRITSLSNNIEIITAIANDISYEEVFAYQLQALAVPGDLLITISSSGDSENVVRAAKWARENDVPVIAMTGFDGGRMREIASVNLHVSANNYGIVEDAHQSLMHILAQFIRQAHMQPELVAVRTF